MPLGSLFPDFYYTDQPVDKFVLKGIRQQEYDAIAFIDADTDEKYTFGAIDDAVLELTNGLHHLGLQKGQVVCVCLPNCPEYAVITLATIRRGAVVSGIHHMSTVDELRYRFDNSECVYVFTKSEYLSNVQEAAKNSKIKKIFLVDKPTTTKGKETAGIYNWTKLFVSQDKPAPPEVEIWTKTDLALLPYSSGTTGPSKGVMLSHYNVVAMVENVNNRAFVLSAYKGDHVVCVPPFFHLFGMGAMLQGLHEGVVQITMANFNGERLLQLVQQYKVPFLFLVPPILSFLAKSPVVDKYDFSSVYAIAAGAAPIGRELSMQLFERFPNLRYLNQGYGMTETGLATHVMPPTELKFFRHGSCGRLLANMECKVIDTETGEELGPNAQGEICVKTLGNMVGYWKNPKATADMIDEQGWLHTGDIGYYDDEEFFFIVDRVKELIKVNAFQVPPAELEDYLLRHPAVEDAAVIGIPNEATGEIPVGYVVLKEGLRATEDEIKSSVNEKVTRYKRLASVEIVKEIPKAPSGKILRRVLRDRYKEKMSNTNRSKL